MSVENDHKESHLGLHECELGRRKCEAKRGIEDGLRCLKGWG